MADLGACLSHKSDHWATPKYLYEAYIRAGYYDPCPLHAEFDGLDLEWPRFVFINPPYSETERWVDRAIEEAKKGKVITMLLASRTDTEWFNKLVQAGSYFTFIRKRLSFGDRGSAPFPSVLVSVGNSFGFRAQICVKNRDFFEKGGFL